MNYFTFIQKLRNKIKIQPSTTVQLGKNIKITNSNITIKGKNNKLIIKDNVVIRSSNLEIIGNDCTISIGNNCMIGNKCYLSAKEDNIILSIGDDCGLSRNVKIMTSDGHPIYHDNKRINHAKSITLKNHIWVADNVTILKGVIIGDNSVIGINSLVTKSMPNNCIIAGNPATIKKENITWKDKFE